MSRVLDFQTRIVILYGAPLYRIFNEGRPDPTLFDMACSLWNLSVTKAKDMPFYPYLHEALMDRLRSPPFSLPPDGAMNLIEAMEQSWKDRFSKHQWFMPNLLGQSDDNEEENEASDSDARSDEPAEPNATEPRSQDGNPAPAP